MDQIAIILILLVLFILYRVVKAYDLEEIHEGKDYGAAITGLRNLETIDDSTFNELHFHLLKYKILVIRNQENFTAQGLRDFGLKFGNLHVHLESASHYPGFTDVNVISNMINAATGAHIGLFGKHVEHFHADYSWADYPAKFTMLKSVIRPDECGDTEFLDTHAAYNDLPDSLRSQLEGKTAQYCYLKLKEIDETGQTENLQDKEREIASKCATHPLFSTHPITGRQNIFANPTDTSFINNMTQAESDSLLQELFHHTSQSKYLYRHRYEDHDLILWDNRAVHHRATGCPAEFPRKLIRVTVSDELAPKEVISTSPFEQPTATVLAFDLSKDRLSSSTTSLISPVAFASASFHH